MFSFSSFPHEMSFHSMIWRIPDEIFTREAGPIPHSDDLNYTFKIFLGFDNNKNFAPNNIQTS